jgi:peroxiredoxin
LDKEEFMLLRVGDRAPAFTLQMARQGRVATMSLDELLRGNRSLVLATYALDFTGG